jgi:hypothetical protein
LWWLDARICIENCSFICATVFGNAGWKDLSGWPKKITIQEFEAALGLCSNTAPGEDGIRFGMLKELPLEGRKFLLHIFNDILFLSNGVVLGSNSDSYQPISMLPCTRKMFEKIILTRLEYWAKNTKFCFPRSMVSGRAVLSS